MTNDDSVEELDETESWRLLAGAPYVRLVTHGGGDDLALYPVNILVRDGAVYFRSAPGSKLMDIAADGQVILAADELDGLRVWSVVARGRARRLDDDAQIEASGVLGLTAWQGGAKTNFVRVDVQRISGRRFTLGALPAS